MTKAVRVVVTGQVQGVGYRAWTVGTANKLGVKGWVRNCDDGSVEAVFAGEESNVLSMIEACKKGPMIARVKNVEHFPWTEEVEDEVFTSRGSQPD